LLTGRPGVGKTTVVMKVVKEFRGNAGGFYTEEIRRGNTREGFRIKTLDGRSGILSHVSHAGPFRVGRYGVDVDAFDEIAIPSLERALLEAFSVVSPADLGIREEDLGGYSPEKRSIYPTDPPVGSRGDMDRYGDKPKLPPFPHLGEVGTKNDR